MSSTLAGRNALLPWSSTSWSGKVIKQHCLCSMTVQCTHPATVDTFCNCWRCECDRLGEENNYGEKKNLPVLCYLVRQQQPGCRSVQFVSNPTLYRFTEDAFECMFQTSELSLFFWPCIQNSGLDSVSQYCKFFCPSPALHLRLFPSLTVLLDPIIMFAKWTETMMILHQSALAFTFSRCFYLLGRMWRVGRRQRAPRLVERSSALRGAATSRSQGLSALPAVKECDCRLAQQEQRQKTADND